MPKFSIIIPAHNSEKYISKALMSVLDQTYRDYELIVVCDSCTDDTDEVAAAYGAKVCYINSGSDGAARSEGLYEATGDWVLFMDDDDWWLHEFALDLIAKKIESEEEMDILCFSAIHKGSRYCAASKDNIAVWNKAWKRSFIGQTRFPPIKSTSDLFFHREMMAKNPKVVEWDMPIYYYNYMRPGSQTWMEEQERRKNVRR